MCQNLCRELCPKEKKLNKKNPPLPLRLCLLLRSLSASIGENFNYSQNYWKAIFLNSLYPWTAEQTWCPPSMTCQLIFAHRCVKNAAESWTLSSVFLLIKQWASEEDGDGVSGKREREREKRMNNQRLWAALVFLTEVSRRSVQLLLLELIFI